MTGSRSTASASLGAPTEDTTIETAETSTEGAEGTELTPVALAIEGDTVDLEVAMLSQGDDDEDDYGKKYRMTSEDRTDRSVARARQKKIGRNREKNVKHCNMLRRSYGKK